MTDAGAFLSWLAGGEGTTELPLLVVVAHPDDEVIGIGAQLPRLRDVTLLHVTEGAPRDGHDARRHGFADIHAYAAARRRELLAALTLAGIGAERALELAIADQEASLHLPGLIGRIGRVIAEKRPAVVVTHPYEGGHPDHDATALAVHAALGRLGSRRPALLEMACYHAGPQGIEVGCFLPAAGSAPVTLELSPEVRVLKRRMLDCFVTQREVLSCFPLASEVLREAPAYDFTYPPHPGRLFYENFPWGMSGKRFRALAAEALHGAGGQPCA